MTTFNCIYICVPPSKDKAYNINLSEMIYYAIGLLHLQLITEIQRQACYFCSYKLAISLILCVCLF